jgi:pimeloyl-ACP methyl ester carboxylesterase
MSRTSRAAGLVSGALGLVAMGIAAGTVAERRLVRRDLEPLHLGGVPLGSLRGRRQTVRTSDGLGLHVEIDDAPGSGAVTTIFVHGYALNLDSWHFQRHALRGRRRMVFYDQRSHGRSERSTRSESTISRLGEDLRDVIDAVAPDGPIALVGHSMGGMAIMALADQSPNLMAEQVVAVGLIATSAGDIGEISLGLPGLPGRLLRRLTPGVLAVAARAPALAESGRRAGSDFGYLMTGRFGFGGDVPPQIVDFADEMLAATPVAVVADFFPDFALHQRYAALKALHDVRTLVMCGSEDAITPRWHSRLISDLLPSAKLVELEGAGHLVLLERPVEVNELLGELLGQADTEGSA